MYVVIPLFWETKTKKAEKLKKPQLMKYKWRMVRRKRINSLCRGLSDVCKKQFDKL